MPHALGHKEKPHNIDKEKYEMLKEHTDYLIDRFKQMSCAESEVVRNHVERTLLCHNQFKSAFIDRVRHMEMENSGN